MKPMTLPAPPRRTFELYCGGHHFTDKTTLAEAAAHTRDFPPGYFAMGMRMVMNMRWKPRS